MITALILALLGVLGFVIYWHMDDTSFGFQMFNLGVILVSGCAILFSVALLFESLSERVYEITVGESRYNCDYYRLSRERLILEDCWFISDRVIYYPSDVEIKGGD
jgi:hypothetical protein